MSTKKAKAWRGKQYNPWGNRMSVASHPMNGTTDCTVIPDGATFPRDRAEQRVMRQMLRKCEDCFRWHVEMAARPKDEPRMLKLLNELIALRKSGYKDRANLDRKRGGKGRK